MSIANQSGQPVIWSPGMTLEQLERCVIEKAFHYYRQNKTHTAKALDISIRTLENKLERYAKENEADEQQQERRRETRDEFLRRSRGETRNEFSIKKQIDGSNANAGLRLESATKVSKELKVSVPESEEIQDLLPETAPESDSKGKRRPVQQAIG